MKNTAGKSVSSGPGSLMQGQQKNGAINHDLDSIAVSAFAVILGEFDKYWIWD